MYRISRNTCVFLKFCIIWLPSPPRPPAAPRAPCELRQPTRTNGTHLEGCPNPGDQWLLPCSFRPSLLPNHLLQRYSEQATSVLLRFLGRCHRGGEICARWRRGAAECDARRGDGVG